jgi:hypothetical protein
MFAGMAVTVGGTALAAPAAAQEVVTEERSVAGIDELELSGVGTLTLIQGETESLLITADEAILPQLTSEVTNGRLVIDAQGSFSTDGPVTYELTVRNLSAILLDGSVAVEGEAFAAELLTLVLDGSSTMAIGELTAGTLGVAIDGAAEVALAGTAEFQNVELDGTATYLAEGLASRQVAIAAGGASGAILQVSELLLAEVEGSATVEYRGDPTGEADVSGAGSLVPLD